VSDPIAVADADPHTRAHSHAWRDTDAPVPDGDAAALPYAYQEALADAADGPAVSAVVACVDDAGRVLLVKQTAGPFAGEWLLPGGNVERDERLEDAARRELVEETGYCARDMRAEAVYEVQSVPSGRFHYLVHLFRAGPVEGTPRPETGSELRWAAPGEIDLHPNLAVALADLGLIQRDPEALRRDLAMAGLEMRRVL